MALQKLSDGSYAEVFATVSAVPSGSWTSVAATGGIVNSVVAITIAPAVAGFRNTVTALQISADALGAATEVAIRDGAAGTVLWRHKINSGGIPGGLSISFPNPLRGTVGNLLEVVSLTASVTGGVFVNAQGAQGL